LLEIVPALRPPGRFARLLNRGQQQGNQDRNDGDHDEQLDQRETRTPFVFRVLHGIAPRRREMTPYKKGTVRMSSNLTTVASKIPRHAPVGNPSGAACTVARGDKDVYHAGNLLRPVR
jgi:hypothetical protein